MISAVASVLGAVLLGSMLVSCAHRVVCEPPPVVNSDSIWHASGGPLQFVSDSTVPQDSVVIVVLDSVHRKPIMGAGARFLPAISLGARADSSGRIALPLPAGELRNESFISAPQLKRDPLDGATTHEGHYPLVESRVRVGSCHLTGLGADTGPLHRGHAVLARLDPVAGDCCDTTSSRRPGLP